MGTLTFYINFRTQDYSHRDVDIRKTITPLSKEKPYSQDLEEIKKPINGKTSKIHSEEECISEESTHSIHDKASKPKRKEGKTKEGAIYCVCSFQSYENGMIVCLECKRFSHAECYGVSDIEVKHICGTCAKKKGIQCTSVNVKEFIEKENKRQKDHSNFAFGLMLRRVLNSVLKEEYKSTQPGLEPGVDFLRIRFGMSTSYANKMALHLVQNGYVNFFGGFKVDNNRIKQFLYPENGNEDQELLSVNDSRAITPPIKESKNGGVGAKNRGTRKEITFTPDRYGEQELEVALVSKEKEKEDTPNDSKDETGGSRNHEDYEDLGEGSSRNPNFTDSFQKSFKKHFLWPSRFLERETRRQGEPVEPIEVGNIGKHSKRAFYGQILESSGPRLNSKEKIGYNIVFSVGRNGESVQVWSFGTEEEINNLSKLIVEDKYMVFWSYEVFPKNSNKIETTSDWCVKIQPKSRNFAPVIVTRKYVNPEDTPGEEMEKFSEKFSQVTNRKPVPRKKELSSKQKKEFTGDPSQPKIHRFLNVSDDKLQLSTSPLGSNTSTSAQESTTCSTDRRSTRKRKNQKLSTDRDSSTGSNTSRRSKRISIFTSSSNSD